MDIWKNKTRFRDNIKKFALKATASAIVTLHAETATAVSCPAYITDTALAGQICDFPPTTGSSVTVENGGEVGGISLTSYTSTSPSYIAINAGGLINNATGIGISITSSSSLSNGISNSGTISTASIGIQIDKSSTINGGISNSGTMRSTNGTGIVVHSSSVTGGISNSGTIEADNDFVGITIDNNSTITGDITNSNLIAATGNGDGILLRSNSTITGGISNSGTISSVSGTGIAVINSSNIQGNISNNGVISGGTHGRGLAIHNGSIVDGSIFNNDTISGGFTGLSIFSATTISGSVSNTGTISGGQTGILISSTATVSGGISNSGTISGVSNAINIVPGSTVSNIDILGQSARIVGAVQASNTTVNITDGAIFTSEGSYNVNSFNIASNALFNMANTITVANAVSNSGTLAISNTVETIAGNYTQQTGGLFQLGVSSATVYGQLSVAGTADLSQSGDIAVQVSQNAVLHNGDVLTDIINGGTPLGAPNNGFNVTDNSVIWKFIAELNNATTGVNLVATINPTAYNACQGTYCQGALNAIIGQVAAGNALFSPYATLSTASALQTAASQATPELTNENIQITQLITRAVVDIVPMWSSLRGRSTGDAMFYQPGKVWVKPYGGSMTQNERNTVNGFDASVYGAVIGKDIALPNDWLVGGGFAAGGDNMRGKSVLSGQSINSQAYQGILYAAKKLPNQVYFAGQGLVGYEINDTSRSIPLYASTAKGKFNSWFTNLRAEAGWSTYVGSPNFVFTPEVDASYLYINQNGYQESGSPMDLSVASNNNSSLVLGVYGNGAYHLPRIHNQHDLTLTGYAGLAGDVLNNQPQVLSTFVASGSTFSTFGVQFNEVVFRGGAGVILTSPKRPLIFELNYDLQVGNNAYSGVGAATIKYKI